MTTAHLGVFFTSGNGGNDPFHHHSKFIPSAPFRIYSRTSEAKQAGRVPTYLAQGSKLGVSLQDHQGITILRASRDASRHMEPGSPRGESWNLRHSLMNLPYVCCTFHNLKNHSSWGVDLFVVIILSHGNTIPFVLGSKAWCPDAKVPP